MLLLLESCPLAHTLTYNHVVREIIEAYYRDYHDHTECFKPVFLSNDVIRFWKTMCLNYEHKRNRREQADKNKGHLQNLKLKFSRMTTCYSTVLLLTKNRATLTPSDLSEAARLSPRERLRQVAVDVPGGMTVLEKMLELYAWFLEMTGRPKDEVLEWIGERPNRVEAFAKAVQYGDLMWDLLLRATSASKGDGLRYLVI